MNLSTHFSLAEFTRSQTATRMGRPIIASDDQVRNLTRLCFELLEPVRSALGVPIQITSGYRPQWLNAAIGGSLTSEHMDARAADFVPLGLSLHEAFTRIPRHLPFNQLIFEFGEWLHISVPKIEDTPKREILIAETGEKGTIYRPYV